MVPIVPFQLVILHEIVQNCIASKLAKKKNQAIKMGGRAMRIKKPRGARIQRRGRVGRIRTIASYPTVSTTSPIAHPTAR